MSVLVRFECDGCESKADGATRLKSHFVGITGRPYGFGHTEVDSVDSVAPDGWVPHDPYTGCCYCPDCWAFITDQVNETEKRIGVLERSRGERG